MFENKRTFLVTLLDLRDVLNDARSFPKIPSSHSSSSQSKTGIVFGVFFGTLLHTWDVLSGGRCQFLKFLDPSFYQNKTEAIFEDGSDSPF